MKRLALKSGIILSFVLAMNFIYTPESQGQMKYKVYYYAKVLGGYGNLFDTYKVTTPGPYGRPVTATHRDNHGNGLNLDIVLGGTISRSKNVSKYSYFDLFVMHRQLFSQNIIYSMSGGGVQGRYMGAHANIVAGYANTSVEVPNKRYEDNILGYGPITKFVYGFGFGFNKPVAKRSNMIMVWDINMLFPKAAHDDLTGYLNFKWFSTSLGIKYYLSRIR